MLESIVGDEDDEPGIADTRVKPALLSLLVDQAELLDATAKESPVTYSFRSGFPTRRKLIEWYQRAAVRTLGEIEESFPPTDCVNDETLLAAVVHDPPKGDPLDPEKAMAMRFIIEDNAIKPACNRAYKRLRDHATEYVKSSGEEYNEERSDGLDPSRQAYVAMRPGFQTIDDQQAAALEEFWGGFDDVGSLHDWLHGLSSPTNGEIDDDIAMKVTASDVAVRHLVESPSTSEARAYQDMIATTHLLPAFVAGVRSMEAAELAKEKRGGPRTLRMK